MTCEHKYKRIIRHQETNYEKCTECGKKLKQVSEGTPVSLDLFVPIEEKDDAKAKGARWDKHQKTWYFPNPKNKVNVMRWITRGIMNEAESRRVWTSFSASSLRNRCNPTRYS